MSLILQPHSTPIEGEDLVGTTISPSELSEPDRDQMFTLMDRYYENVTEDGFRRDLDEKDWVIVARHAGDGTVRGFSTQLLLDASDDRRILFSGDTIFDRAYWGRNPLARQWGQLAFAVYLDDPGRDLFWFLISKGYKTYRILGRYFEDYFPRHGAATPTWAVDLIAELGEARYPDRFDAAAGIVRAGPLDERLRPDVAALGDHHRRDPAVRFFERWNPGHELGDELCCVARMAPDNLRPEALALLDGTTP